MKTKPERFSRKFFSTLAGSALLVTLPAAASGTGEALPYWKDQHVVSVNREEPRTSFMDL